MSDTPNTDIITVKQPTIDDLVNAVVGANGNVPLAHERLVKRGMLIDRDEIVARLASDPTADDLISKQFRLKAKLVTYQMLMSYQAELMSTLDDDERPMTQQGAVQGFTAISNLFTSLTDQRGAPLFSGNVLDRIMAVVPPEAREAIATLAATEPPLPAPTPIRKMPGRPRAVNHSAVAVHPDNILDTITSDSDTGS